MPCQHLSHMTARREERQSRSSTAAVTPSSHPEHARDTGADKSTDEASFLSQEIERGQEWQAKDGEMIRLDALEQMHAKTLELIGPDTRHHGRTGRFEIGIEERLAECTHGHA